MCTISSWPCPQEPSDDDFRREITEDITHLLPPDQSLISARSSTSAGSLPPGSVASSANAQQDGFGSAPNSPRTSSRSLAPSSSGGFFSRGSTVEKENRQLEKMRGGGEEAVKERRKYMAVEENRKATIFQPGFYHAFEVFNPYFDPMNFTIKIPGITIDLMKVTNGLPMRSTLMSKDGKTVFLVVEMIVIGGTAD
ncbi:hypothetical protein HK101_010555 [Irineochytrium annulatum]|nr:hypothetical protein HK101_010555 [Irineochytrium annulatum]